MKRITTPVLIVLAFLAGSLVSLLTSLALAHGGDPNLVHSCVKNTILNAANVRIVGPNDNCNSNETALDWPKQAGNTDFVCVSCKLKDILHRKNQTNVTNTNFDNAIMTQSFLNNIDLSGSSFVYAVVAGVKFSGSNGTNTDFSNANLTGANIQNSANFTGAKFINADMSFGSYDNSTFTNADFTNANLSNAFLNNSIVTGANFTGVIWSNTTCPDGTNSNDNGNTCEGHLTPAP